MYYLFEVLDFKRAEQELILKGLTDLYQIEEKRKLFIGGRAKKRPTSLRFSKLIETKKESVDWEEQYASFSENFHDGEAHIDLAKFGRKKTLRLLPGAGFGDLSHPTTYLMLEMMGPYVKGRNILDIGAGSGILSLAALLLGAKSATGLDIDPKAIAHAKANARLNHLKARFVKSFPPKIPSHNLSLLNMILPEQKVALKSIERYNTITDLWIVSGILKNQKREYLKLTKSWRWKPIRELEREGWLGWIFGLETRGDGLG